jgi:hypothetical protein
MVEMLKKAVPAALAALVVVLANEHGYLEAVGGKSKAQAKIDHP